MSQAENPPAPEVTRLADLSPQQWRSGIAAWLGWLFDGLDMHLYTLVATPFVAYLLSVNEHDPVGRPVCVVDSSVVPCWLGAGGRYFRAHWRSIGAQPRADAHDSYLRHLHRPVVFRPRLVAFDDLSVLSGAGDRRRMGGGSVDPIGNLANSMASLDCGGAADRSESRQPGRGGGEHDSTHLAEASRSSDFSRRHFARVAGAVDSPFGSRAGGMESGQGKRRSTNRDSCELFKSPVRRITITVILVCATSLSGHWAFMFWFPQQLRRLPDVQSWTDSEKNGVASTGLALVMIMSICGNFFAGFLAKKIGYRRAVSFLCLAYFISMMATYSVARDHDAMLWWLITPGLVARRVRAVHDVSAAVVPDALAHHRRGLLLQHRPHCRRRRHDLLWQLQR